MEKREIGFVGSQGKLHGLLERPAGPGRHAAVVLVPGSGPMSVDHWGGWPTWIGWSGLATFRYDKPGVGQSVGSWQRQEFRDAAADAAAAVRYLQQEPDIDPDRIGLFGISQGGWVGPLAAAGEPAVSFVGMLSGSAVSPGEQERYRLQEQMQREGLDGAEVEKGIVWYSSQLQNLRARVPALAVSEAARSVAGEPWGPLVTEHLTDPETVDFLRRILDFELTPVLQTVKCPIFAAWGEADDIVPARESHVRVSEALKAVGHADYETHVFPNGNHGCFVAEADEVTPTHERLAPGFLDALCGWLRRVSLPDSVRDGAAFTPAQ